MGFDAWFFKDDGYNDDPDNPYEEEYESEIKYIYELVHKNQSEEVREFINKQIEGIKDYAGSDWKKFREYFEVAYDIRLSQYVAEMFVTSKDDWLEANMPTPDYIGEY